MLTNSKRLLALPILAILTAFGLPVRVQNSWTVTQLFVGEARAETITGQLQNAPARRGGPKGAEGSGLTAQLTPQPAANQRHRGVKGGGRDKILTNRTAAPNTTTSPTDSPATQRARGPKVRTKELTN